MGTYNWTGTGGNDLWSNLNNWNPNNGPPGGVDTADISPDGFSVDVNGTSGVGDLDLGFFFIGEPAGSTVTVDNGGILDVDGSSNIFRASTLQSQPGGTIYLLFSGTLTNGGTILVGQDINAAGGSSTLAIDGAVTLTGGGTLELGEATGNPFGQKSTGNIGNYPNTSDSLVNQGNTISGAGSIVLGAFDNQVGGTVEAGLSGSGTLSIAAGTFSNEGTMVAGSGATLSLGQDNASASLTNNDIITVDDGGTLQIAGDYTVSGTGEIQMAGGAQENAVPTDQITSDEHPAELVLTDQYLEGAGTVGDGDLTLVNAAGVIAADVPLQGLVLNTGNNVITNGGTLEALIDADLEIQSPVANSGTIEADGGAVVIQAAVTVPSFPAGEHSTIDIGADGIVVLAASVAGNVTFTSGGAALAVDCALTNGGIGGDIVGAVTSDVIFFDGLSSPIQQVLWQQNGGSGTLSVEAGASLVSINLAGQYTSGDFMLVNGGTEVELQNPGPPSLTTADMIIENVNTGNFEIYDLGSNAVQASGALGQPFVDGSLSADDSGALAGQNWQVAGLGDFFGGDTSDMLLRESSNGMFEVWDVANNNINGSALMGQVGIEWTVSGFGDFSGNANETDMLLRNSNNGNFEVYDISNNAITFAAGMGQVGLEWTVAGFGDFSGNADESDMLLRNSNDGNFEVYDISDNTVTFAAGMGQVGLEWSVAGFGDFSGNPNETDMLMRNSNNGDFEVYDISNNTVTFAAPMGQVGLEWSVAAFGDLSGNPNETDMLMRNSNTGAFEYYDISGNQTTGAGSMGQVGLEWSVAGIAADLPAGAPANSAAQLPQQMASYTQSSGGPGTGLLSGQATVAETSPFVAQS